MIKMTLMPPVSIFYIFSIAMLGFSTICGVSSQTTNERNMTHKEFFDIPVNVPFTNLTNVNKTHSVQTEYLDETHVGMHESIIKGLEKMGGNSSAFSAFINSENGVLVYNIFILDKRGDIYRIISDANNGKLLSSQQMCLEGVALSKKYRLMNNTTVDMWTGGGGSFSGGGASGSWLLAPC